MKLAALLLVAICVVFSLGCGRSVATIDQVPTTDIEIDPTPEGTISPIPIELLNLSPSELCDQLAEIKILPTKDPEITDPIYEALIAKGDDAAPCLIENISDRRKVPDPRYSVPHWQHYTVGDTAVFVLLDILSGEDDLEWRKLMIETLPPRYKEEWKTNGIYAYFNYVSEPKNRKELQNWWKRRLKQESRIQKK